MSALHNRDPRVVDQYIQFSELCDRVSHKALDVLVIRDIYRVSKRLRRGGVVHFCSRRPVRTTNASTSRRREAAPAVIPEPAAVTMTALRSALFMTFSTIIVIWRD
jgi:hypothetical protein